MGEIDDVMITKRKLTISIVSYHNVNDIIAAVDSIEKYTSDSIKKTIYIIDNADDENEYKFLLEKYNDLVYIKTNQNLGFGKGHNYIINNLDSEYHAIVNPDIILIEDSFLTLIDFMESDPSIGISVPRLVNEENELLGVYRRDITFVDMFVRIFGKHIFKKRYQYHVMADQDYSKPFCVPFAQGSFFVIRTQLYKDVNGFDDVFFMYLEDADLCKRVNMESTVMYCPYTTVVHKWEKGSHKNFKLFRTHIHSLIKYFKKWGFTCK